MNYYVIPLTGNSDGFLFSEKCDDGGAYLVLTFCDSFIFSSKANKHNADVGIALCNRLNEALETSYEKQ